MTFFSSKLKIVPAAILLLTTIFIGVSARAIAEETNGEVARVNDQVILRQDLDREMKLVALQLTRQGRSADVSQMQRYRGNIRETMINRALLLQKAATEEINVRESLVGKAVDAFKETFDDEKAYNRALTRMGFGEEAFQQKVRDGLIVKTLIDKEVIQKTAVSDQEVREYYDSNPAQLQRPEQVKAAHILTPLPEGAGKEKQDQALAAIQALKVRLDSGENFAVLAMEHSDCPSKAKGGDLGFFGREQMVVPFSEAAFALEPGQVSDVVKTRFGYHLIRVTEKRMAETRAFNDVKAAISAHLRREKEGAKIEAYLEKLKARADIKRFAL
jgi:peptidyl-prolyl cis-trans isomerase C